MHKIFTISFIFLFITMSKNYLTGTEQTLCIYIKLPLYLSIVQ
jgi:hypothetical protein